MSGIGGMVNLDFQAPNGKVAGIMGVMNLLQSKFENLSIEIEGTEGDITDQDYEDKIREESIRPPLDLRNGVRHPHLPPI